MQKEKALLHQDVELLSMQLKEQQDKTTFFKQSYDTLLSNVGKENDVVQVSRKEVEILYKALQENKESAKQQSIYYNKKLNTEMMQGKDKDTKIASLESDLRKLQDIEAKLSQVENQNATLNAQIVKIKQTHEQEISQIKKVYMEDEVKLRR